MDLQIKVPKTYLVFSEEINATKETHLSDSILPGSGSTKFSGLLFEIDPSEVERYRLFDLSVEVVVGNRGGGIYCFNIYWAENYSPSY